MISATCEHCDSELDEFGALAFSPPSPDEECAKYHICVSCWAELEPWLWNRSGGMKITDRFVDGWVG